MKEFLGFGGYSRPAEGFLSWQHLLFVGLLLGIMVFLGVYLGKKYRHSSAHQKNKVMIVTAILINALELFKIIVLCLRSESAEPILYTLPLFFLQHTADYHSSCRFLQGQNQRGRIGLRMHLWYFGCGVWHHRCRSEL